jgi:hypothetical protein
MSQNGILKVGTFCSDLIYVYKAAMNVIKY